MRPFDLEGCQKYITTNHPPTLSALQRLHIELWYLQSALLSPPIDAVSAPTTVLLLKMSASREQMEPLKVSGYCVVHVAVAGCCYADEPRLYCFSRKHTFPPMLPCIKSILTSFGVYLKICLLFNMSCGHLTPALTVIQSDWLPTCRTLVTN